MTIRAWMVIGLLFAVAGLSQACPTYVGASDGPIAGEATGRSHNQSTALPFTRREAVANDRLLVMDPPVSVAIPLPAGGITGIITLSLIAVGALRQRYRKAARHV